MSSSPAHPAFGYRPRAPRSGHGRTHHPRDRAHPGPAWPGDRRGEADLTAWLLELVEASLVGQGVQEGEEGALHLIAGWAQLI